MHSQEPLISVIVPVYNVSAYLDRCMQSLVGQTYRNLEIILVDDGSTDNSGQLCDLWAEKDSRIRVIHRKNNGLSQARNTGLDAATGDYITFVDSDDILSPHLCQVLFDAMGGTADISICDAEHIFEGRPYEFSVTDQQESMIARQAINQLWYQKGFLPSAWGKLYRRELFTGKQFTVGRIFEDIDIMHELFFDAKNIVYNRSRLYGYVHRAGSITTKAFCPRDLDILLVADKILAFTEDKPDLRAAAEAYAVTAALRVYLNAPNEEAFAQGVALSRQLLSWYGKQVMADPNIRTKNRCALRLYFYCRPLMRFAYKFINRWK